MIAVDTSVLVATAFEEEGAETFADGLLVMECVVGWPTVMEAHMVMVGRHGAAALEFLAEWIARDNVTCRAFDGSLYQEASTAFSRFGLGRGHAAKLNFGDCMSYAVARAYGVPLLYKGGDFALTDIRSALP